MSSVVTITSGMAGVHKQWADNVKQGRKLLGFTQPKFAQLLDVSQSTVCRWENGEAVPRDEHKVKIANALRQEVRDLFPLNRDVMP